MRDAAGEEDRKLTDADIKALADELEDRMVNRFYRNLGHGVWGLLWKLLVLGAVGLAAYGATKH